MEDRIRAFCVNPRSKEEIAEHLHIGSTYYLVTRYLRPMLEEGKFPNEIAKSIV